MYITLCYNKLKGVGFIRIIENIHKMNQKGWIVDLDELSVRGKLIILDVTKR